MSMISLLFALLNLPLHEILIFLAQDTDIRFLVEKFLMRFIGNGHLWKCQPNTVFYRWQMYSPYPLVTLDD